MLPTGRSEPWTTFFAHQHTLTIFSVHDEGCVDRLSWLTKSGHWPELAQVGYDVNDAVDGAHSAASECHRVVASK
jgi:hypothetical protein